MHDLRTIRRVLSHHLRTHKELHAWQENIVQLIMAKHMLRLEEWFPWYFNAFAIDGEAIAAHVSLEVGEHKAEMILPLFIEADIATRIIGFEDG